MVQVVLGTWVALLAVTTLLFVLVCVGQRVWRAARTGAAQVRPTLEHRSSEQRRAA